MRKFCTSSLILAEARFNASCHGWPVAACSPALYMVPVVASDLVGLRPRATIQRLVVALEACRQAIVACICCCFAATEAVGIDGWPRCPPMNAVTLEQSRCARVSSFGAASNLRWSHAKAAHALSD